MRPKQRLVLAFAISIALHEVIAGLIPPGLAQSSASREVVKRTTIARLAIRRVPAPMSSLRPAIVVKRVRPLTVARPSGQRNLTDRAVIRVASAASAASRERLVQASRARPVWDAAAVATKAGSGAASLAGTGNRSNGASPSGERTGEINGDAPCGYVIFSNPHGSQYDTSTRGFYVDIRMSVRFADGTTESMILDYPWYYPSEAANPWSDQNVRDPNFPMRFQQPPPGKVPGEPPLVQYVMAHSTADGLTLLHDCPGPEAQAP